jgi:DNA-binding transcriptional LysR family regulator
VKLFSRSIGAVQPTPAGTAYYSACVEFLKAHEMTLRAIEPFKGSRQGEIKVGMTPVMTRAVLAPAYARFTKENPNVTVRIIDSYFGELTDRVRSGELTFAIVPSSIGSKGVRTSFFASAPEMLVSGRMSSFQHCKPVKLADLPPLNLAIPGQSNARRKLIDAYITSNGVGIKSFAEFDTMAGTMDLVSRGEWATILPMMMIANDIDTGKYNISPIEDPPLILETFVIEPARKSMSDVALDFLECVKEEFAFSIAKATQLLKQGRH